jgi:UDP-N-acetylmuramoyl-L-alanyl-D-glutamate--2,6-diaminopimelate ligase
MALCFKIDADRIAQALTTFSGVPGRLQKYMLPNGASCVIDYAHNPSSYEAVLSLLKSKTNHLIVIFGAGGKRDASKRPIMGAIAAQFADIIILTSDNPRDEDPIKIINDIAFGIPQNKQHIIMREVDREQAIKKAYSHSKTGTIIAILGKGTDEYQIIGTNKIPFSEATIIASLHV